MPIYKDNISNIEYEYRNIKGGVALEKIANGDALKDPAQAIVLKIPEMIDDRPVSFLEELLFTQCFGLKEVYVPQTVRHIGHSCFFRCENLADIHLPETMSELGGGAFYSCASLKAVRIPRGIKSISSECFSCCLWEVIKSTLTAIQAENTVK